MSLHQIYTEYFSNPSVFLVKTVCYPGLLYYHLVVLTGHLHYVHFDCHLVRHWIQSLDQVISFCL